MEEEDSYNAQGRIKLPQLQNIGFKDQLQKLEWKLLQSNNVSMQDTTSVAEPIKAITTQMKTQPKHQTLNNDIRGQLSNSDQYLLQINPDNLSDPLYNFSYDRAYGGQSNEAANNNAMYPNSNNGTILD